MRSTSAPPNYNHNDTMAIQSVDIIELAPAEQGMKLSVENEINSNHIDMESAQATLKEAEQEGQEEDSKRNVSNTNTLSSIM